MRLNVNPLESVGDVKFGMTREEVRSIFGDAEEFKKDPDDDITTDDFGFCHVFYDEDDRCEAVEIFDAEVFIDGKQVYSPAPAGLSALSYSVRKSPSSGQCALPDTATGRAPHRR